MHKHAVARRNAHPLLVTHGVLAARPLVPHRARHGARRRELGPAPRRVEGVVRVLRGLGLILGAARLGGVARAEGVVGGLGLVVRGAGLVVWGARVVLGGVVCAARGVEVGEHVGVEADGLGGGSRGGFGGLGSGCEGEGVAGALEVARDGVLEAHGHLRVGRLLHLGLEVGELLGVEGGACSGGLDGEGFFGFNGEVDLAGLERGGRGVVEIHVRVDCLVVRVVGPFFFRGGGGPPPPHVGAGPVTRRPGLALVPDELTD